MSAVALVEEPSTHHRCATCGYGVAQDSPPHRCPMCGRHAGLWLPFRLGRHGWEWA